MVQIYQTHLFWPGSKEGLRYTLQIDRVGLWESLCWVSIEA